MTEGERFTAIVQRNLSYLIIGGVILLIVITGTGLVQIPEALLMKLFDAAFLVVLLYWFQRQRSDAPAQASLPPSGANNTPALTAQPTPTGGNERETSPKP